jgi:hypothetical protein
MLSIEKCLKTLNTNKKTYTKEEVITIRDTLFQMGYIEYELSQKLNSDGCNNIYKSIN